jgi:hypothetical protein
LALWESGYLGSESKLDPKLDPKLLTSQVGSGSGSKSQRKMGSGSEKIVSDHNTADNINMISY